MIDDKAWPTLLSGNEWSSGDTIWLLDIIGPNKKAGTSVFMNFNKLVGDKPFKIHPSVLRMLDDELVQKIGTAVKDNLPQDKATIQ